MRILGLPVTPPLYGLNWGLTNAQVELLMFDTPITVYPKDKKQKKDKTGKPEFGTPSENDVTAAAQRWKEKYEGKDTSININDFI